jgi:hypothetical protein
MPVHAGGLPGEGIRFRNGAAQKRSTDFLDAAGDAALPIRQRHSLADLEWATGLLGLYRSNERAATKQRRTHCHATEHNRQDEPAFHRDLHAGVILTGTRCVGLGLLRRVSSTIPQWLMREAA